LYPYWQFFAKPHMWFTLRSGGDFSSQLPG
jgi:hypothetical protein